METKVGPLRAPRRLLSPEGQGIASGGNVSGGNAVADDVARDPGAPPEPLLPEAPVDSRKSRPHAGAAPKCAFRLVNVDAPQPGLVALPWIFESFRA